MIEGLLRTIDRILSDRHFSWGAVITALLFFNKIQRNKEFRLRDQRVERNQQRIMAKLEVEGEWAIPTKKYWQAAKQILSRFYSSSPADIPPEYLLWRKKMKAYLTKLGSRKFQAFLIITATNIIMLVGYLLNIDNIQTIADSWMPVINLVVQAITTMVYQIVQGGVDKEAQKQQVYITPAPDPSPAIIAPAAAVPTESEFEAQVEAVNTELNRCLNLIKTHNYAEAPADAIHLYSAIHALIKGKSA